jgi:hypothetical protein
MIYFHFKILAKDEYYNPKSQIVNRKKGKNICDKFINNSDIQ